MAYMYTTNGLGCACSEKLRGLGDIVFDAGADSLPAFTIPTFSMPDLSSVPTWAWITGGMLALWFITGATGKRRARRQIYAQYKKRLDDAESDYSTKGRLRRARRRIPKLKVVF